MAADSINVEVGICKKCGDMGPFGTTCVICDDSSEVYMAIKEIIKMDKPGVDTASLVVDMNCFTSSACKAHGTRNVWLGDSGASCHMTHSDEGFTNWRNISSEVQLGNGEILKATKIGDKKMTIIQKDGSKKNITLKDCKYVPGMQVNLFSITKALENGWGISNNGPIINLIKDNEIIKFDQVIPTETGSLIGLIMHPHKDYVNVVMSKGNKIDINLLHKILGHTNEDSIRNTAKYYGIEVQNKMEKCVDCALSKAKQKSVKKYTNTKSEVPGERLFIDISSVQYESLGGAKYWLLIVDDCTDMCWSAFLRNKSDAGPRTIKFIKELSTKLGIGVQVMILRLDNAGENKGLENLCIDGGLNIKFEYISPGSPQYNGRVERKFATLYGKIRSVLNAAKLPEQLRKQLWAEAAQWTTYNENIIVTELKPVPSYVQFYKQEPPFLPNKQFAELAIVADHKNREIRGKLTDRGIPCLYLGLAENHSKDVYRLLNLNTHRVIMSRDVTWINKTYGEWKGLTKEEISIYTDEDDEIEIIERNNVNNDESDDEIHDNPVIENFENEIDEPEVEIFGDENGEVENNQHEQQLVVPPNPKVVREMKRLYGFFNPEAMEVVEQNHQQPQQPVEDNLEPERDNQVQAEQVIEGEQPAVVEQPVVDQSNIMMDYAFLGHDKPLPVENKIEYDVPRTFEEAWNHPDPYIRARWREAIMKELTKMDSLKVWKVVKRSRVPKGRRCVKYKWVFDIKRDGRFRARLVACGYSQIPGVDFTESFSPVVNESVFRIVLVAQVLWKFHSNLMDVETAFLHGDLEEEIYMECPEGVPHEPDECLLLLKALYGLVQSARQFYKKFTKVLRDVGFTQSNVEPCLFYAQFKHGRVLLILHVDDCYVIGHPEDLKLTRNLLEQKFKLKVEENVNDYLSCQILFNKEKSMAWLGQPHLMGKIEKSYGHLIPKNIIYKTPGTPNYNLIRPENEDEKVSAEKQAQYRSVVGSLLQLVKYSRPDLANSVRELAKCMDGATMGAYKEMTRVLKFAIDTKDFGIKIQPKLEQDGIWNLTLYSDSDWAGDKNNRRSVSGFIIFLCGVPIMWKSRLQKTVALSSTEAEYYALSEAAKEIKFIIQVLQSIGQKIKLPVIVRVDNVGAIFMCENTTATARSRHIDARYHFIREFIMDGYIKIIFVKSEDNSADIFTKNVNGDIYRKHVDEYLMSKNGIIK
jgi:hypothetical protein